MLTSIDIMELGVMVSADNRIEGKTGFTRELQLYVYYKDSIS